jgi:hypothetical protein
MDPEIGTETEPKIGARSSNYEKGENPNVGGKAQVVSIRATNVFRKEQGKWKMIGHQVDPLPLMAK